MKDSFAYISINLFGNSNRFPFFMNSWIISNCILFSLLSNDIELIKTKWANYRLLIFCKLDIAWAKINKLSSLFTKS